MTETWAPPSHMVDDICRNLAPVEPPHNGEHIPDILAVGDR